MNAPVDLAAVKGRQQLAWASGDYAVVGTTLQIVGESLAEACDLRWDEDVLDVAAGNGNATLAAARRGARVTSTDYVSTLLDRGATRAQAEGLDVRFQIADAEALPFESASFDAVLSTFGVMFAPDHAAAAPRWRGSAVPAAVSALRTGRPAASSGRCSRRWVAICRRPRRAAASVVGRGSASQDALRRQGRGDRRDAEDVQLPLPLGGALHRSVQDLVRAGAESLCRTAERQGRGADAGLTELLNGMNRGGSRSLLVPSEYLEVVVTRK
jgi:SAM-dependent methyltransferase